MRERERALTQTSSEDLLAGEVEAAFGGEGAFVDAVRAGDGPLSAALSVGRDDDSVVGDAGGDHRKGRWMWLELREPIMRYGEVGFSRGAEMIPRLRATFSGEAAGDAFASRISRLLSGETNLRPTQCTRPR